MRPPGVWGRSPQRDWLQHLPFQVGTISSHARPAGLRQQPLPTQSGYLRRPTPLQDPAILVDRRDVSRSSR